MWHLLEKPNLKRSHVRSPGLLVFTLAFHFAGERWKYFQLQVGFFLSGWTSATCTCCLSQRRERWWASSRERGQVGKSRKQFSVPNSRKKGCLLQKIHCSSSAGRCPGSYHMNKINPIHDSTVKEGQDAPLPPNFLLQLCPFPDQYFMCFTWCLSLPLNSWLHNEWSHIWVARKRSSASCWWADVASVYPQRRKRLEILHKALQHRSVLFTLNWGVQ